MPKYDNSERLSTVSDQDWCEALDELTTYLKWRLKGRTKWGTICTPVRMQAPDGKQRITLAATTEGIFRFIQSIPSPKAEPFKQWMAEVAAQRIDQMQDPELNFEQAYADYRRLGYSDKWINQRLRSIEVCKALTDEWDRAGVQQGQQ